MRGPKIAVIAIIVTLLAGFIYMAKVSIATVEAGGQTNTRARQLNEALRETEEALGR